MSKYTRNTSNSKEARFLPTLIQSFKNRKQEMNKLSNALSKMDESNLNYEKYYKRLNHLKNIVH